MHRPILVSETDRLAPSRRMALGLLAQTGLVLTAPAWAQDSTSQTPSAPPDAEARLLANLLTRIGVEVDLDGRKALFVIDTGAERSAVSDRLAQALDLPPGPPVLVHGITTAQMTPTVRLPHLAFSERRFADLVLPVFPYGLLGADGLLGLDVLSRFRLTLDLRRRRVMIAASGADVVLRGLSFGGRASRVGLDITDVRSGRFSQLILTQVAADGVPAVAFIDSGAQYSIGNRALMRALDSRLGRVERPLVRVYGVIGQSLLVRSGELADLRLARRDLGPTPLLFGDLHAFRILNLIDRPALLLGADVLTRFSQVTLDYGRGRIALGGLARRPTPQAAPRS
ncbi:pepsin/retropepsin-like aspartic protease family protein [Brevundimonas diminuta]|uniref:pepsin/retropepsin-like aspartic protease family protein n=1 Tax=Brevundimonas diminuta TaxID=293 RepID=UPI0022AFFD54|nr:pepsin/retropepsin-like aspartic protease family protein [Brevundimonas diminuta]MCZ4106895.1 pepsin/retropepsin-like aspartic protease family protein [Brevundimonas diminuta]